MTAYKVNFTEEAEANLDNIFDFILLESADATLAESFSTSLVYTVNESLSFMPTKHPIYKRQVRRFVFPKYTNYSAFFKIDEPRQMVFVLAITQSKQFTRYFNL